MARFIVILLHELSHAVPALIFTKKQVTVYIGHTKKDITSAKKALNIGLLKIYIAPKLVYFNRGGFCIYNSKNIDLNQELIIISSGAGITALISVFSCYTAFKFDAHALTKLTLLSFCVIALFSLIKDLYPRKSTNPVLEDDHTYSDGNHIIDLLNNKVNATIYIKAVNFYSNKEYQLASGYLKKLIARKYVFTDIFRKLISSLIMTEDYKEAYQINTKFFDGHAYHWTSKDYYSAGTIKLKLNLIEECIIDFNECIKLSPDDKFALNNRGYANNLAGRYFEAIADFNKALYIDPNLAYAYCNRGFAKMKTGQADDGLTDIGRSLVLDAGNAYAYFKMGIYYFDKGNFTEALKQLEKAKRMDLTITGIDKYIDDITSIIAAQK